MLKDISSDIEKQALPYSFLRNEELNMVIYVFLKKNDHDGTSLVQQQKLLFKKKS